MNKKGFDTYAALLLVVVIIALGILFVQIQTKFSKISTIGEHQTKILGMNNELDLFEFYLTMASEYSFDNALLDVINAKPFITTSEKIEFGQCTEPIISESFEPKLTERFNYYLKQYLVYFGKDSNFELMETDFLLGASGLDIIVSSKNQITMNFRDKDGKFIYRPVVLIDRANKLREYKSWTDLIKTITKMCNKSEDPMVCGKTFTEIYGWNITEEEGIYYVIIPLRTIEAWGTAYEKVCFKIQMEKSVEKTSHSNT